MCCLSSRVVLFWYQVLPPLCGLGKRAGVCRVLAALVGPGWDEEEDEDEDEEDKEDDEEDDNEDE